MTSLPEQTQANEGNVAPEPNEPPAEASLYCYLDWRPVGAVPLATCVDTRREEIALEDVKPYQRRGGNYLGSLEAFGGAQVLARADGLFVFSISVDAAFPMRDLDELALAVSMAAKAKLGHVHDVHRADALPQRRRTQRNLADATGDVLVSEPIAVECEAAIAMLAKAKLEDNDLATLRALIPDYARRCQPGEVGRPALICLRRRYLKVFETLQEILKDDRDRQRQIERAPLRLVLLLAATIAVLAVLFVAFLGWPVDWSQRYRWQEMMAACFVLVSATLYLLHNADQLVSWDHPRIRLLRSSQTFYHYANPLNVVIGALLCRPGLPASDFAALQGILEGKAAGETHRAGMRQFWMTLTLAIVAVYFGALSIRESTERAIAKPELERAVLPLDCGVQFGNWLVGPFAPGEAARVEPGGATPGEVLASIGRHHGGLPEAIVLIGSTDETPVRPGSPIGSNSRLARLREQWVASEIARLQRDIQVLTFDQAMPSERLHMSAGASGREVFVCGRWRTAV